MNRFFCTECKKVKRVRHLPTIISAGNSSNPQDRVGKCNRHVSYRTTKRK